MITGFVNIYKGGSIGALWPDRATADKRVSGERVACISIEAKEGQYDPQPVLYKGVKIGSKCANGCVYSKSMDQPYPRRCKNCGYQE